MNYNKKSVEDIDVAGKRVLCRCDFNVPTKDGKITSDKRIVAALPTIQYLVKHGARVILCSHMGKPKNGPDPAFSLQVVAERLSELLGQPVKMAKDVVGESAQSLAASLKDGEVMLLENTRFEKGETKNDPELSKKLASMADIFVNDAFGTAHRAHASTALIADAGLCLRAFCPNSFCQIDAPQRRCLFSDFQNRLSVCALFARFDRNQTLIWLYRCKRLFQSGNDAQLV